MRKLVGLTTVALTLATVLVVSSIAQQPSPTELSVDARVSPNDAGTKRKPQGVTLTVTTHWETPEGLPRPVVQRALVLFPKGSVYNGGKYPKCSKAALAREGLGACPTRSIMGKGSADAWADTVLVHPKITVVNGGRNRVYLYTVLTQPARVQAPVDGILRKRTGKWAYELELLVPTVLQRVAGIPIQLRDFTVTAGRKRGRTDWLATTSCPANGRWPFSVETFYNTGGSSIREDSLPCRR